MIPTTNSLPDTTSPPPSSSPSPSPFSAPLRSASQPQISSVGLSRPQRAQSHPNLPPLRRLQSSLFLEEEESEELSEEEVPEETLVARNRREWIYFTLSKGLKFSKLAFAYQIFQNIVILISVVNFLISTLPKYWESDLVELEVIEKLSVGIFTIDYFGRFFTCEPGKRCHWVLRPLHLFDLAVIVPFYIEVVIKHGTDFNPADDSILVIVRALRLFQMFRTVKIARYSSLIPVFVKALALSKDGFVLFTFTVSILMVVVSSILFYAEQTVMVFDYASRVWLLPDTAEMSTFQSIPGTFWWFIATITTVGYGDSYPISDLGKVVASITMVGGLFVLAVPVAVFGSNFASVWDERMELMKEKHRRRRKRKYSKMDDDQLIETLERQMLKYTHKLERQKAIVNKLVEEEKEILDILYFLGKNDLLRKASHREDADASANVE